VLAREIGTKPLLPGEAEKARPSLDALTLRSDVISSIKILSPGISVLAREIGTKPLAPGEAEKASPRARSGDMLLASCVGGGIFREVGSR